MDAVKRTPRWQDDADRRAKGSSPGFVAKLERQADDEESLSIKRVEAIRRQLPRKDRRLIDLYLRQATTIPPW